MCLKRRDEDENATCKCKASRSSLEFPSDNPSVTPYHLRPLCFSSFYYAPFPNQKSKIKNRKCHCLHSHRASSRHCGNRHPGRFAAASLVEGKRERLRDRL